MNELNNLPGGMLNALIAVAVFVVLAGSVIYCFYVKNLQDTLKAIRPENRQMEPAQVWLLLASFLNVFLMVPVFYAANGNVLQVSDNMYSGLDYASSGIGLFTLIWQFRIVQKLSDSIAQEYASRNIPVEAKPAYQPGLIFCCIMLGSLLLDLLPRPVPGLSLAIGIGIVVYWIKYWIKTAAYKKELRAMPEYSDNESDLFRNLY